MNAVNVHLKGLCLCAALLVGGFSAGIARADDEDEMMGFIVDDCISLVGHNFYNAFTDRLRATSRLNFNLVVRERPDPRWGSLIWVEYDQRIVYRRFIAPNATETRELAQEAADQVRAAVVQRKLQVQLQDNIDLGKDEL
ncbi:curli production assembly/transport protein CsgE [Pseudomonas sp. LS-2]|jgi:curli production assembly/transport component CsgE|uniref:curli production assembly/transport protein CsgE n=1 Tax=Pseudomonas sp. LS-2 TaxID=2315859 RepID=UPI000E73FC0B|nr:curli production assembly/transport protein CsgE [Pseudomonas sp. LS-2]RJX74130.1 curli production assembly/transport protein CsgE [Pseudomonas sp. LS-2]